MDIFRKLLIIAYFYFKITQRTILITALQSGIDAEYCLNEEFKATCLKNEIILIETATFGRMRVGRCLGTEDQELLAHNKNDHKFLGCQVDVSHLIDEKCFGRNQCGFRLYEIDQNVRKTCHTGLQSYMQATYSCAAVVEPDRSCTVSVTSSAQHLMTSQSSSTKLSCGSRHQPWKLEAPAGQQINVSLLDFGGAVNQRDGHCLQYGYIIDRETNRNVSMCSSSQRNAKYNHLHQSKSNVLEIVFGDGYLSANGSQTHRKILVRIEAVGCTDVIPPEDMWLRRRNQESVVGCYSSRQTWHLNCVNNQWLGVIGNCTREIPQPVVSEMKTGKTSIKSTVLAAIAIILIGFAICAVIICCGVICIKRYNSKIAKASHIYNVKSVNKGKDQQFLVHTERFLPPTLQQA